MENASTMSALSSRALKSKSRSRFKYPKRNKGTLASLKSFIFASMEVMILLSSFSQ